MLVHVTQEHIDKGIASDCKRCPIALALLATNKFGNLVVVGPVTPSGKWYANDHELPEAVGKFAESFDLLEKVEPFTFEM